MAWSFTKSSYTQWKIWKRNELSKEDRFASMRSHWPEYQLRCYQALLNRKRAFSGEITCLLWGVWGGEKQTLLKLLLERRDHQVECLSFSTTCVYVRCGGGRRIWICPRSFLVCPLPLRASREGPRPRTDKRGGGVDPKSFQILLFSFVSVDFAVNNPFLGSFSRGCWKCWLTAFANR